MKTTKFKCFFFVFLMLLLLCSGMTLSNFFAADVPNRVFSSLAIAEAGSTIEIPILIDNNTGFAGMGLVFKYDSTKVLPLAIKTSGSIFNGGIENDIGRFDGLFSVNLSGIDDETDNGLLFTITFHVNESADGSTIINVSYDQENTFDESIEDVALFCEDISLTIQNDFGDMPVLRLSSSPVYAGENVKITGSFAKAGLLDEAEIILSFDSSAFEYVSMNALNGSIAISNIIFTENNLRFRMTVTSPIAGDDLFVLTLHANPSATGNYSVTGYSKFMSIIEGNVTVNSLDSIAIIRSDSDMSALQHESLVIPVYLENNPGLMGYKLTIKYNPTIMTPLSVANSGVFTGTFDDNIGIHTDYFDVKWYGTEQETQNGKLFDITFRIDTDEYCVPTVLIEYSQPDTFNEEYQDVAMNCRSVKVLVNPNLRPELKFSGASLTLHDNIAINFKADRKLFTDLGYSDPFVIFTMNGVETTVHKYRIIDDKVVFDFNNIAPHKLNDTVYVTLYATYSGEETISMTREYSVATYCYNMLTKYSTDEYSKLRTLLVNLLNYGESSQIYANYKTDALVTKDLTPLQKMWGTQESPSLKTVYNPAYTVLDSPSVQWEGVGLNLTNSVAMRFRITTAGIAGLSVKVSGSSGGEWIINNTSFVPTNGGYYVYFNGLNVAQLSEPVYLTVYDGNVPVSNTICYSVESYAYANQNDSDQKLSDLVISMMNYGNSAYAYVH
ncbi:MAG: hypothetical protein ILO53_00780 [Clostridia bacterium]|nr:hypothetical protein [Clostridia bacterium]